MIKGITDRKTYCEEQTFTIEETNLESVLVDGVAATPDNTGKYVLTDKAGNRTIYTVTVNNGHNIHGVMTEAAALLPAPAKMTLTMRKQRKPT